MQHLLRVLEGLFLLSSDTKARARPQFGLLNRRGFQSSTQSGKVSRKKSDQKLKSGRGQLPSVSARKLFKNKPPPALVGDRVEQSAVDSTLRMLIRLWSHESTRVYLDRNTDSKERMWFLKLLEACIKYCFCGVGFEQTVGSKGRPLLRQASEGAHTASLGGEPRLLTNC